MLLRILRRTSETVSMYCDAVGLAAEGVGVAAGAEVSLLRISSERKTPRRLASSVIVLNSFSSSRHSTVRKIQPLFFVASDDFVCRVKAKLLLLARNSGKHSVHAKLSVLIEL